LSEGVITTGVDDLLELLRGVSKISIPEAAEKLGVTPALVQSWVDFLVEEEIVGMEYKFTKPLIYLNKTPAKAVARVDDPEDFTMDTYRQEFWKRALERRIPDDKIPFFWQNHAREVANSKKDFFYREARKRKLENIDTLWSEYLNTIVT